MLPASRIISGDSHGRRISQLVGRAHDKLLKPVTKGNRLGWLATGPGRATCGLGDNSGLHIQLVLAEPPRKVRINHNDYFTDLARDLAGSLGYVIDEVRLDPIGTEGVRNKDLYVTVFYAELRPALEPSVVSLWTDAILQVFQHRGGLSADRSRKCLHQDSLRYLRTTWALPITPRHRRITATSPQSIIAIEA